MIFYLLCGIAAVLGAILAHYSPVVLIQSAAAFIWQGGLVFMGYGLARDILFYGQKPSTENRRKLASLCFDSVGGGLAVALGLGLEVLGWTPLYEMAWGYVLMGTALILALGHFTREWVLVLVALPNHRDFIPTWKIRPWKEIESEIKSETKE